MRDEALAVATRALARREHSRRSLAERLQRAGIRESEADEVLAELERLGLLDDGRFALERARVLAERGKGDAAIRFDLERSGVSASGFARCSTAGTRTPSGRSAARRLVDEAS